MRNKCIMITGFQLLITILIFIVIIAAFTFDYLHDVFFVMLLFIIFYTYFTQFRKRLIIFNIYSTTLEQILISYLNYNKIAFEKKISSIFVNKYRSEIYITNSGNTYFLHFSGTIPFYKEFKKYLRNNLKANNL